MSADGRFDEASTDEAPLSEVSESEINALVDEVLRSGKHHTNAPESDPGSPAPERFHARVRAGQLQQLARSSTAASTESEPNPGSDDRDEWWFELDGARLGPISLRKVRYLWEDGALTPDSLCWHEGFPTWVSLFRVSELAEALAPKPPRADPTALKIETPPAPKREDAEIEWSPPVGPALESSNRERLAATQQPVSPPAPAEVAGVFATLPRVPDPTPEPPPVPKRRSGVVNGLIGGLAAGTVVAAAVLGARVFWPEPPSQPTVVVIRDPAPAPVPVPVASPPPASTPGAAAPAPTPPKAAPSKAKVVARAEPKPVPEPQAAPAPQPEKENKPATVDDAFAQEFGTVPDELQSSEIFEVVGSHKAEIESCVEAQKAADPTTSGRLVMRWNVQLDGRVSDVSVRSTEFADIPLAGCLQKQIRTWAFPKHEVQHAPVEFPFNF